MPCTSMHVYALWVVVVYRDAVLVLGGALVGLCEAVAQELHLSMQRGRPTRLDPHTTQHSIANLRHTSRMWSTHHTP
jgi:hypothetical protein